jgi:hypothetical protein
MRLDADMHEPRRRKAREAQVCFRGCARRIRACDLALRTIRLRGDELDLYGEYHFELVQEITRDVGRISPTPSKTRARLRGSSSLSGSPDREQGGWRGWLFRVAQLEAWRLTALEWKDRALDDSGGWSHAPIDP